MPLLDVIDGGFDVIDGSFNVVTGEADLLSPPPGYMLLFEDVFSAAGNPAYAAATPQAPVPPDPAKWGIESGTEPGNAIVDGSKLILRVSGTSVADRTASSIRTSDSPYLNSWRGIIGFTRMWPAPGWLEVVAKPSTHTGVMSEIVLFTDHHLFPFATVSPLQWRLGEIDLLEARGFQPTIYDHATHAWTQPDKSPVGQTNLGQGGTTTVTPGFHQFVAHFGSTLVRIYTDGMLGHARDLAFSPDPFPIFGMPTAMYMGCWIGTVGDGWAGAGGVVYPIPANTQLEIESVRYYTQGAADDGAWL